MGSRRSQAGRRSDSTISGTGTDGRANSSPGNAAPAARRDGTARQIAGAGSRERANARPTARPPRTLLHHRATALLDVHPFGGVIVGGP